MTIKVLVLDVENEIRNVRTRNRLKTLDIDKKSFKIPDTQFEMVVTMESSEFHRVCVGFGTTFRLRRNSLQGELIDFY